jgi:hypothetical protein
LLPESQDWKILTFIAWSIHKLLRCFASPPFYYVLLAYAVAVSPTVKFMAFLRKKHLTKPDRGQFHFRRPSKILWRTIRGMLPHKTARGQAALDRLKCFEGIPPPYDKVRIFATVRAHCTDALHFGRGHFDVGTPARGFKARTITSSIYFHTAKPAIFVVFAARFYCGIAEGIWLTLVAACVCACVLAKLSHRWPKCWHARLST